MSRRELQHPLAIDGQNVAYLNAAVSHGEFHVTALAGNWLTAAIPISPSQVQPITFTRTVRRWIFPQERFVTYTDSDERWCRFFGIGHEGDVREEIHCEQAYIEASVEPGLQEQLYANLKITPLVPVEVRRAK